MMNKYAVVDGLLRLVPYHEDSQILLYYEISLNLINHREQLIDINHKLIYDKYSGHIRLINFRNGNECVRDVWI